MGIRWKFNARHFIRRYSLLFLETPSDITKDKIRCYKSLDAWTFFICGHVQDVFIYKSKTTLDFIFIKSAVLPSQRQGQKEDLYETWCVIHKTGWILSGNCTCTVGKLKLLFVYYYRMLQVSIKYQYIQYSTDYSMCLTQVSMKVYILKNYQDNNFGIIFVNTILTVSYTHLTLPTKA